MPTPDLKGAYAHCRRLAFGHYENFPVASLLLPAASRDAVAAVYAFARQADDFADEPEFAKERVKLLKAWMAKLDRPAQDPVFVALQDSIRRHRLPKPLLRDLVRAFLQDCRKARYRNFEEVLAYCKLSADPVGRLVLRIFNADDARACAESDAICTALQLTNHWQDLASDAAVRDRVYLPQDEMKRFGVKDAQLKARRFDAALAELLRLQVDRAEALFTVGEGLPARLGGRLGLEIRLTLLGGRGILDKIRKQGYDTLAKRPTLGKWNGPKILWRGLRGLPL